MKNGTTTGQSERFNGARKTVDIRGMAYDVRHKSTLLPLSAPFRDAQLCKQQDVCRGSCLLRVRIPFCFLPTEITCYQLLRPRS
jgi:hypothetical protein